MAEWGRVSVGALILGAVIAVVGAVVFALISGGSNGSLTQGFGGPVQL